MFWPGPVCPSLSADPFPYMYMIWGCLRSHGSLVVPILSVLLLLLTCCLCVLESLSHAIFLLAAGQTAFAQRSDDESICDYYAAKRYGESNITTQLLLVQSIVTLAYAGGHDLLPDADNGTTGIFNEGLYKGVDVYLRPWFDGSSKKDCRAG